jgi:hypothetical protein
MSDESREASPSQTPDGPEESHDALGMDETIAEAEEGSQVTAPHRESVTTASEDGRLEEIHDAERDGDSVTGDPGSSAEPPERGPGPTDIGSGGAQHVVGARISDRVSTGQPVPDGPPFDSENVRKPEDPSASTQ